MAHSIMIRAFVEITDSRPLAWNTQVDYQTGDDYVMQTYFLSWDDGAKHSDSVRDGGFFQWLKGQLNPKHPNAQKTLHGQIYDGRFNSETYKAADQAFKTFAAEESAWLRALRLRFRPSR
jgi:hypothetical protein